MKWAKWVVVYYCAFGLAVWKIVSWLASQQKYRVQKIMIQDDVTEALQTLHELMVKWHWGYWAEFLDRSIRLYHSQSDEFCDELGSISLWGGSGALWESNAQTNAKATYEEELRFRRAFITLAKYINDRQIGTEGLRSRSAFIASTFEYWISRGI